MKLPGNEEQNWVRVASLFLALPSGAFLARLSRNRFVLAGVVALFVVCLPTTVRSFQAYRNWDMTEALTLTVLEGELHVAEERWHSWPPTVAAAEAALPDDAVLLIHPSHPGAGLGGLMTSLGSNWLRSFSTPSTSMPSIA